MCGGRIAQFLCLCVEIDVGGGNKLALRVAAKNRIHPVEKTGRIVSVSATSGGGEFDHRGDERSGYAVTGDIRDQQAHFRIVCEDEVVEVAGDGTHGKITGGNTKGLRRRERGRQDGGLDALGDLELFPDDGEFLFISERTASGNNTQQNKEDDEAEGFDVVVVADDPRDVVVENSRDEENKSNPNESDVRRPGPMRMSARRSTRKAAIMKLLLTSRSEA